MKFKINDEVKILKTNNLKIIIDCERILNKNIYYMSDITSYCEDELCEICEYDELINSLEKNRENILKIIDCKKTADNWVKYYNEHKKVDEIKNSNKSFFTKIMDYLTKSD
jgi:hypothetical protein